MSALLWILAIAGLLWWAVLLRHAGLVGGALAVLLGGSCFGHAFFHLDAGPLPITADRVLLGSLLVVFLVYRMRGQTERTPVDPLDLWIGVFGAVLVISTFAHDWQAHSNRALASLLFFYLMPVVLYAIARQIPLSDRALRGTMIAFALFGLYLAITAIFEQQRIWSLVYPRYIVSAEAQVEFLGRGRGPFLNPVANGTFLCLGLFSLMLLWPRAGRFGKLWLTVAILLHGVGIYCTLTRVVWLAAAAGTLAMMALQLPRRWAVACLISTCLLGAVLLATKWDELNAFKRDRYVSVQEMAESASLRPILAYVAWQMFLDRPLFGCGYRQYEDAVDGYLTDHSTPLHLERARQYTQHNVLLALLAETGVIGAGLFVLVLLAGAGQAWQLWRCREHDDLVRRFALLTLLMLLAYVIMGMFHDLTLIPMIHMGLFLLVGLTRHLHWAMGVAQGSRAAMSRGFLSGNARAARNGLSPTRGTWGIGPSAAGLDATGSASSGRTAARAS